MFPFSSIRSCILIVPLPSSLYFLAEIVSSFFLRLFLLCYVGSIFSVVVVDIHVFVFGIMQGFVNLFLILVVVSSHPPIVFVSISLVIFAGCSCSLFCRLSNFGTSLCFWISLFISSIMCIVLLITHLVLCCLRC